MFCDIVKAHSNLSVSGTDSMRKEVSRTLFFFKRHCSYRSHSSIWTKKITYAAGAEEGL